MHTFVLAFGLNRPVFSFSRTHCQTAVGFVFVGNNQSLPNMSTGGEVANAAACKAVIHGFKSHPVLQFFCTRMHDRNMASTNYINGDLFFGLAAHPALEAMCLRIDTQLRSVGERAGT